MDVIKTAVGNTLTAWGFKLKRADGKPVDLTGKSIKVFGKADDGTAWISETDGVVQPSQTFTASSTDSYITANDHLVTAGDQIVLTNSGGALPGGLAAATRYFPINITENRFQLALTANGASVTISDAGSGTNSFAIVNSAKYDPQTSDVATAGTYWLWANVYSGSEFDTYPIVDEQRLRALRVDILEAA